MENKLAIYQLAAPAMGCPTCSQGLNGLFNSNPDRQAARQAARADRQALRAQNEPHEPPTAPLMVAGLSATISTPIA